MRAVVSVGVFRLRGQKQMSALIAFEVSASKYSIIYHGFLP